MKQNEKRDRIIVSLTSYPARICHVHKVVKTLLIQNRKPDSIMLWLAESEFLNREEELPVELLELCKFGLEIKWCDDLKSHKKYFYVMQENPDSIIITVDDDVYYSPRVMELLYDSYLRFPNAVSCLRSNRILTENGRILPYDKWDKGYAECVDEPVVDLLPVGMGGVLYPPHCMPKDTFNKCAIEQLCIKQDDLWLKAMEVKAGILAVLVKSDGENAQLIENTQEVGLYKNENTEGNDAAIQNICEYFFNCEVKSRSYLNELYKSNNSSIKVYANTKNMREEIILKCMQDNSKIVIYGAGEGALAVYESLINSFLNIMVYCFAVTEKDKNPDNIHGVCVKTISDLKGIKDECFVLVSTAEKNQREIRLLLKKMEFKNIWYVRDKIMVHLVKSMKSIGLAKEQFLMSCISDEEFETNKNI
jgi:hypothetical protein